MAKSKPASPFPSIVSDFGYSPLTTALWRDDASHALSQRDLSMRQASAHVLDARHWRTKGAPVDSNTWAKAHAFSFLFVLAGKITLREGRKKPVVLGPLDAACRHGYGAPSKWTFSHDAEWVEISASTQGAPTVGVHSPDPQPWHLSSESEPAYALGEGPRRFFKYRDLGVAAATGRRLHIHVVRATGTVPGGTGWHTHTMGQIFYVLRGWADLAVIHQPWFRMGPGDAMCLGRGMAHDVPAFSGDYLVLEMCIPADYDTAEAQADA